MSEEELPEKLDKLEIAPSTSVSHDNCNGSQFPNAMNPFYTDGNDSDDVKNSWQTSIGAVNDSIFYPSFSNLNIEEKRFKSRIRRRSESILDSIKLSPSDSTTGVRKQSLKKVSASTGVNRKIILREPILRVLQNCGSRRKLQNEFKQEEELLKAVQPAEIANTIGRRGMTDFRDLIDECRTLLVETGDPEEALKCNCKKKPLNYPVHRYNARRRHRSVRDDTDDNADDFGLSNLPVSLPSNHDASCTCPSSSTSSNNWVAQEQNAFNARMNHQTSCSQQAGNGMPRNADDVTIDELASYFDTFVHIPKKMSSMAEMMYI